MPTPNGRLTAKDFVRFFEENSARKHTLLSTHPYPPDLWVHLFTLRFGSEPEPGQGESYRVKRGSTDPRWNTFLHQEKAYRIVRNLRCYWLKQGGS